MTKSLVSKSANLKLGDASLWSSAIVLKPSAIREKLCALEYFFLSPKLSGRIKVYSSNARLRITIELMVFVPRSFIVAV